MTLPGKPDRNAGSHKRPFLHVASGQYVIRDHGGNGGAALDLGDTRWSINGAYDCTKGLYQPCYYVQLRVNGFGIFARLC
jgi:hypothetical protein